MLQSMGSQRVGCDLVTEQQQHPLSSNSLVNNEEPVVLKFIKKNFLLSFFKSSFIETLLK